MNIDENESLPLECKVKLNFDCRVILHALKGVNLLAEELNLVQLFRRRMDSLSIRLLYFNLHT